MIEKQDRTFTRTAADLERKHHFTKTFGELEGLATGARAAAEEAEQAAQDLERKMTPEQILAILTDGGKNQGLYRGEDGELYINATYIASGELLADLIKAGVIKSRDGESLVIDLDRGTADLTGTLQTTRGTNEDGGEEFTRVFPNGLRIHREGGTAGGESTMLISSSRMAASGQYGKLDGRVLETSPMAFLELSAYAGGSGAASAGDYRVSMRATGDHARVDLMQVEEGSIVRSRAWFSANGSRVMLSGLTAPVSPDDAVNKAYVDALEARIAALEAKA